MIVLEMFLGVMLFIAICVVTALLCNLSGYFLILGGLGLLAAIILPFVYGRSGIAIGVLGSLALVGLLFGLCIGMITSPQHSR